MGRRAGPPQVRRHGATWWARYSVAGRRVEENLGLPATRPAREAQAEAEARRARAVLAAGVVERPAAGGAERDLEHLIFRYLDHARSLGRDLKYAVHHELHLKAHFLRCDEEGHATRWRTLDDITTPAIHAYTAERIAAGISTVTVHKELVTLSRFLLWAKREGLIEAVPDFERPRASSSYQPIALAPADVKRLIAALPERLRPWARFTWLMALRATESRSIEWRDVDWAARTLTIRAEIDKAGRTWVLPLDDARLVLARLPRGTGRAPIFRVTRDDREALTAAAERLGLGHVTPHHLRHSRLTELGHSTRDVASLQYFARHTSLQTTDGYVHGRTAAAAEMLAASGRRRR